MENIIAVISLVVSLITLYLSHLRGPKIELVVPENKTFSYHNPREIDKDNWLLVVRFLVVNIGNRPGVLFSFLLEPVDEGVGVPRLFYPDEVTLPQVLTPGSGWQAKADIQVKTDIDSLKRYAVAKGRLRMKAIYIVSSSLFGRHTSSIVFWINLKPLIEHLQKTT